MAVENTPIDAYVAAFRARCDAIQRPGQPRVDEPGVHGLLPSLDDPLTRLVVTDDRAYDTLDGLLPGVRAGIITVFPPAIRCTNLIAGHQAWTITTSMAMLCRDLRKVPAVPLPGDLALRPVRRLADDAPDGVPLRDAAAAAMRADPEMQSELGGFVDYLRSLSPMIRLLAAVDAEGAVRATAGSGAFGSHASVLFVNTDPRWRGRGIGRAMTAAALHGAQQSGAEQACLNASDAGLSIYRRLGFEAVDQVTRFFRPTHHEATSR